MPQKYIVRFAPPLALLSLFAAAGWIGGIGFMPDVSAIRELQDWRTHSPQLTLAMIALTQLGSVYATLGSGLAASLWLGVRGDRTCAALLAAVVVGERLIVDGLKLLLDRARPAFDAHPVITHSSSFPSGHSANTMAVFLAIALIAVPERWRRQAVILALSLSALIGFSRPYLGVHWPSDVIGGWALGATIAILAARFAPRDRR